MVKKLLETEGMNQATRSTNQNLPTKPNISLGNPRVYLAFFISSLANFILFSSYFHPFVLHCFNQIVTKRYITLFF